MSKKKRPMRESVKGGPSAATAMRTTVFFVAYLSLSSLIAGCGGEANEFGLDGQNGPLALTADSRGPFSFQSDHGQYVSADYSRGSYVIANRGAVGAWEQFTVVDQFDGYVALRAYNGWWVSADLTLGGRLIANRAVVGPWEEFQVVGLSCCYPGRVALLARSTGKYVSA